MTKKNTNSSSNYTCPRIRIDILNELDNTCKEILCLDDRQKCLKLMIAIIRKLSNNKDQFNKILEDVLNEVLDKKDVMKLLTRKLLKGE